MSCDSWRDRLIELARGRLSDLERNRVSLHVGVCRGCSLFLEEQRALTTAVTELAADTIIMVPPADLESILVAEFDSARSRRRRYWKPAAAIGAIAAALACFAVFRAPSPRVLLRLPVVRVAPLKETAASPLVAGMPARKSVAPPFRRPHPAQPPQDAEPFTAIPYTVPLDPRERVTVRRVAIPVAALVAIGLTAPAPDPAASAQADVVVGEDGRIRAIRLVAFESSDRRIHQ
jgi:hypothetical protein